jgi:hypothetical protein
LNGDLEGAWSDENFWRVMSLIRKPSMTTSPRKNLPRTSLFFSVQILSLGAVDKSYNCMCELNKATHYLMKQRAMVYFLRKFPSVKLQRLTQISAKLNQRLLSHCRSGGIRVAFKLVQKKNVLFRTLCLLNFLHISKNNKY